VEAFFRLLFLFSKGIDMRLAWIVMVMFGVSATIYFISSKLLMLIVLFIVGTLIASAVEKGKDVTVVFIFHRCCAAVQWALMSFYLFVFETLPSHHLDLHFYYLTGTLLLITLGLYVFATANVQTLLMSTELKLSATQSEKRNFFYAAASVILLLVFLAYLRFRLGVIL
jgi:hypothetical protein